jgi:hypothetical protein
MVRELENHFPQRAFRPPSKVAAYSSVNEAVGGSLQFHSSVNELGEGEARQGRRLFTGE